MPPRALFIGSVPAFFESLVRVSFQALEYFFISARSIVPPVGGPDLMPIGGCQLRAVVEGSSRGALARMPELSMENYDHLGG